MDGYYWGFLIFFIQETQLQLTILDKQKQILAWRKYYKLNERFCIIIEISMLPRLPADIPNFCKLAKVPTCHFFWWGLEKSLIEKQWITWQIQAAGAINFKVTSIINAFLQYFRVNICTLNICGIYVLVERIKSCLLKISALK